MEWSALDAAVSTLTSAAWGGGGADANNDTPASTNNSIGFDAPPPNSFSHLLDSSWFVIVEWLSSEESSARAFGLRALDCTILTAASTLKNKHMRKQIAHVLIDTIVGDESAWNRMEAAALLGKYSCALQLEEGNWLSALAYEVIKANLFQLLPAASVRAFDSTIQGSQGMASSSSSGSLHSHRRTPSNAAGTRPLSSSRATSPASSTTTFSNPAEAAEHTSSLICALEAFGYLLDTPAANLPIEADAIDELIVSLLSLSDLDLFVRCQTIQLLTHQFRHTYRNRRRIIKYLPAIKRLMGPLIEPNFPPQKSQPPPPAPLHPYLMQVLSHFVSCWYFNPPDRLLRRFPTPQMLRGYALRQFHKLSSGVANTWSQQQSNTDTKRTDSKKGHRKNLSSFSQQSSSSLSASVYSLLDSDQLGWAAATGVDALIQDLMRWQSKRTLLSELGTIAAEAKEDRPTTGKFEDTRSTTPKTKMTHRGRSTTPRTPTKPPAAVSAIPGGISGWNLAANASISLSNEESFVDELLSQWSDLSFNIRMDMTVSSIVKLPPKPMPHNTPILLNSSSTTLSKRQATRVPLLQKAHSNPSSPASAATALVNTATMQAQKAIRDLRSRTLEFDVKTHTRILTLTNRSDKHAHDFYLQLHPSWIFHAEPAWGRLKPNSSLSVRVTFQPSPLDLPGTKIGGYLRIRSLHGFALERVELLGVSGPSLRILNAGGAPQESLLITHQSAQQRLPSANATNSTQPTAPAARSLSTSISSSVIDFGICFLGVPKTQHLYVQNLSSVSTQATICYLGTDKEGNARTHHPSFTVIPSLLFLRPHETKRISIVFYPRTIQPVTESRIAILGLGEESYIYSLRGRGGVPFKILPTETLDFGVVDMWKGSGKDLAKEMNLRENADMQQLINAAVAPITATNASRYSANNNTSASSSTPVKGVYREYITIVNHNPNKPLPVSFRYSGQKNSMPSDGSDTNHPTETPDPSRTTADSGSFSNLTQISDFDVLYCKDTVVPPGSTQRIPVTFIAHAEGSFSKRLFINTPITPTDSLSVLVTAHVGPLLSVGSTSVIHLPPAAANTAVHYVVPIVNLSRMHIHNIEIQGLKRTPIYFAVSKMPAGMSAREKRKAKRASQVAAEKGEASGSTAIVTPPPTTMEELNDYFDPVSALTCNLPNLGRDFLPAAIAINDFTSGFISQFNDRSFTIGPHQTLLLHLWFVTHIPGFYCIPFQVRTAAPFWNTYGPIEIKAVCLARSNAPTVPVQIAAPPSAGTPTAAGGASGVVAPSNPSIHYSEDPATVPVVQGALEKLAASGVQFRGDVSSVSYTPLKRFSRFPNNKGITSGFYAASATVTVASPSSNNAGQTALVSKSYASELVAVPSDRFDEELKSYVIPTNEGSGTNSEGLNIFPTGVDYLIYKLPNSLAFSSTLLKLPPRLWLWNRKTLLLMLTNLTSNTQAFHTILTFPYTSTVCTEIEKNAEFSAVDGKLSLGNFQTLRKNIDAPNRVAPFKAARIDVALLSLEEYEGQKVLQDAATERAKSHAAAAAQAEANEAMQWPATSRNRRLSAASSPTSAFTFQTAKPSWQNATASLTDESEDGDNSLSTSRRYHQHQLSTGYLAVIDEQNHLSVCVLRGMLGDLVSIELPAKHLVFNCTTANANVNAAQTDSTVPAATPVTLHIPIRNHTDLNIAIGFKFGSGAAEVMSTTVPTISSGFSMLRPNPSVLAAYETRFIPITFAPTRLGRFQSDFVAYYKNPYQPSERFEFFSTKLIGNYIAENMVEFEGENASMQNAQTLMPNSSPLQVNTAFIDCGTVIVGSSSSSNSSNPSAPSNISAASNSNDFNPLTLHNNSSLELSVNARGVAPFYVTLPPNAEDDNDTNNVSSSGTFGDASGTAATSIQTLVSGGLSASRRKNQWAEKRAARLRQKSGNTYVLDDGASPRHASSESIGSISEDVSNSLSPLLSSYPPAVTQLLYALNTAQFRVHFRPNTSLGSGLFASQIIVSFLHYFKLIDCFGRAGKLHLQSNVGPPTSSADLIPTATAARNTKPTDGKEEEKTGVEVSHSPTAATSYRPRFGFGFGNNLSTTTTVGSQGNLVNGLPPHPGSRHIRDHSMPVGPQSSSLAVKTGQKDFFPSVHQRSGSMQVHQKNDSNLPNNAAVSNAIDLGLSPIKRLLKKSFVLTNTGSIAITIGCIDIVNAPGGVTGGTFQQSLPTQTHSTAHKPLPVRQGGMKWTFAHTTIVRGASADNAGRPMSRTIGKRSSIGTSATKSGASDSVAPTEYRLHTLISSSSLGPCLNVHGRQPLNPTVLKSNSLSNTMRKRRAARQLYRADNDQSTSTSLLLEEGFEVDSLENMCVDFDEVDYQLELENLSANLASIEADAGVTADAARLRANAEIASGIGVKLSTIADTNKSVPGLSAESSAAADSDDEEAALEAENDAASDFPIVLHPGHSLPLLLWYYKDSPGAYFHEVQVSCVDSTLVSNVASGAVNLNDKADENARIAKAGARRSLNSPLFIGNVAPSAETKKAIENAPIPSASNMPSAALWKAAAQGDFTDWDETSLRSLLFKRFNFLFRISAQDVLKFDGGFQQLDFGIVKLQSAPAVNSNSLAAPTITFAAASTSGSKPQTISFMNEGSIPLHWRIIKLNVELSKVKRALTAGTANSTSDDEDETDSDMAEYIDESRIHEAAFFVSPQSGVIGAKQRQTVTIVFNPPVPHLKYVWTVALQTQEMNQHGRMQHSRKLSSGSMAERKLNPTVCRLIGVAGSSLLQLSLLDDLSGVERPMPASASGGCELNFGCISIGCDRHKRFLLRNMGELPSTFELKNSSQRFHLIPSQGVVPPYSSVEIQCRFQPHKAKFYSSTSVIRWGSADPEDQSSTAQASGELQLSESIRLLITGKGGLSDLLIPDTSLNFGTVTIHQDHVLLLRIQNLGAAEGQVSLDVNHPSIRLKESREAIFVPAGSHFDVTIIFHPTDLTPLDTVIVVRSPTSSSLVQEVRLRGEVGVPNIVVEPLGILDHLDFGTCLTNTQRHIDFTLTNMGNVDIQYEIVFLRLKQTVKQQAIKPINTSESTTPANRSRRNSSKAARREQLAAPSDTVVPASSILSPPSLDQYPSLTRVRHSAYSKSHTPRTHLTSLFGLSQSGGGAPANTTTQNDLFYEDCSDQLEEFTPQALSIYPTHGRISAAPLPGEQLSAMGNQVRLTLTFAPTQSLEMLECALLIRSTHSVSSPSESDRNHLIRQTSSFDGLYAIVRGLAGEQRLIIDSVAKHIDFGICRVGVTYTKTMILSNPGNIRVDYHIGPDLDNDSTWNEFMIPKDATAISRSSPTENSRQQLQQTAMSNSTSSGAPVGSKGLDYSSVRKLWLESFNALGFDLIYSGEVLPGRTSTVTILFTPRDESYVKVKVRIVSNAKLETIEIEGTGAQSQLHLLRSKNYRPDLKAIELIDFGLLPIVPRRNHENSASDALVNQSSAYRKLFWLYNSGNLPCTYLISRNDLPGEFEIRPMEATVPPYQFMPLAISFHPQLINHPINFMLKFFGTAEANHSKHLRGNALPPLSSKQSDLSVAVRGSGGYGILGVCFLNDADIRLSGLDFDVVSVHTHHMVEKYLSLYNCGSVPLRIKVDVDNPHYSVGIAGSISSLSMQIVDVVTATPIDEAAVQNEIRYNAKLNKYHVTNTHHMLTTRRGNKLVSHEKAIGQSAFDYQENDDGTLEKTSRASVLTYLIAGTAAAGNTTTDNRSRRGSRSNALDSALLALAASDPVAASAVSLPMLPTLDTENTSSEVTPGVSPSHHGMASSSFANALAASTSTATSNPFTAKIVGASSIEEVLMPGKYIPIFVRLLVAEEKSYIGSVRVSSEHSFLTLPVRAEGGVVHLSHTGSLDFGTIGCCHRYSKTIILRNTGTVPTRAKLFWNIRGNGQDKSGGSTLALSGATPFSNPFINSSDEDDTTDDEEEVRTAAMLRAAARRSGSSDDSDEDETARALRALKLVKRRAARQQRKAAKEARAKEAAAIEAQSKPLEAVDTYKSIIRLYSSTDAPPTQLNITRLWWQHCIKFIRILLRSYKMMYPARAKNLFKHQQLPGEEEEKQAAASTASQQKGDSTGRGRGSSTKRRTGRRSRSRSRSKSKSQSKSRSRSRSRSRAAKGDHDDMKHDARSSMTGGLEDYMAEVESKRRADEAAKLKAQQIAAEEARLQSEQHRIKQAVIKVAEMDPSLKESIGGSALEPATDEAGELTNDPQQIVDSDVGLPVSHPMYASAVLLSQRGKAVEGEIRSLVEKVHKRFHEGENPALMELLAAASRLNIKIARKKLPRIGDPGDGLVDMKTADSADRVPQLRLAPGTILLAKESKVEIAVDLNVPSPGHFNATLVVECELAGVDRYEIPLRATAAQVNFVFDDNSKLDFGRLPLGETEMRTRTLTNLGEIPVKFKVENDNPGLTITPMEGVIPPGRRKPFAFTFRPVDETVQQLPIRIYTNCTPTLTLPVFGAGGVPKLHMDNFERMDFGRCMIGKSQTRVLRLTNTGNANLPILAASLDESVVFHKGLRAQAAKDAAEQLNQRDALRTNHAIDSSGSADASLTGVDSNLLPIPRRSRGRDKLRRSLGPKDATGDDNFGLNEASLANANSKARVKRSIYLPAGATVQKGNKKGIHLLSALGLPVPPDSDSDGAEGTRLDDGIAEGEEEDEVEVGEGELEGVVGNIDSDDEDDSEETRDEGLDQLGHHDWPIGRINILPGETLELAILFRPPREDIFVGRVVLETSSQAYNIELLGTGREALLVYDQKVIHFDDCLVGNSYTKEFSLMNVGEVKYPVKLILQDKSQKAVISTKPILPGSSSASSRPVPDSEESALSAALHAANQSDSSLHPPQSPNSVVRRPVSNFDLKVFPSDLILGAFEKKSISVTFTPTRDLKCSAKLILDSIYSHNVIHVHMLSGTASLELSTTRIDFGLVEQGHKVSAILNLKNTGTLPLAYRIKPPSLKPFHTLPFTFSKWSGIIGAGLDVDLMCRAHLIDIGSFSEELCIETERVGQRYFVTVAGECAKSYVDPNKFEQVNFGYCQVGESVSQVIAIQNEGGYPLDFDMKFNYPLSVTPKSGRIMGQQLQTFQVQWIPTGGYDMRSVIHMDTNIGVFDISVRGVGAYPRFVLRDAYLDFGVCAFQHTYRKAFTIVNTGKVGIAWSIPSVDVGYAAEPEAGILGASEETQVIVSFTATRAGIYHGNFIVESKGRYREVNVVGIGGVLSLDYPELIDMGSCACGQWANTILAIRNTGDVTLHLKMRLDRNSINAEHNPDEEEQDRLDEESTRHLKPRVEMVEEDMPSVEYSAHQKARVELLDENDDPLMDESDHHARTLADGEVAGVLDRVSSADQRFVPNTLFAVHSSPSMVSIPPRTLTTVMVRTFVPMDAKGRFSYRLQLRAIEATLVVEFTGVATTIHLSNYARTLLLADREQVLTITRTPHPFKPDVFTIQRRSTRYGRVIPDSLSLVSGNSDATFTSPNVFFRPNLVHPPSVKSSMLSVRHILQMFERITRILGEPDHRNQTKVILSHAISSTGSGSSSSKEKRHERHLSTNSVASTTSTDARMSLAPPPTMMVDDDVIACYQCLDSMLISICVVFEHVNVVRTVDHAAQEIVPFFQRPHDAIEAMDRVAQVEVVDVDEELSSSSELFGPPSEVKLVSRLETSLLPSALFAYAHPARTVARITEAHAGDSGTGRSLAWQMYQQAQPQLEKHRAATPSLEFIEAMKQRQQSQTESVLLSNDSDLSDGNGDESEKIELGIFGITHEIDPATSAPLTIGINDAVNNIIACEPQFMFDAHDALLKYIEPCHNVNYLQILPELLANPPEVLDFEDEVLPEDL